MPQLVVFSAFICHQLVMGALLDNCAFVEYGNFIAKLTRGQTMGNVDCGFVTCDLIELSVDLRFGNRVESSRRLV